MCRLALMNSAAARLLGPELAMLYTSLEYSMGGHGNGVATLWKNTGTVSIHKGCRFTTAQAAARVFTDIDQGAQWALFHTRLATAGDRTSKHCHPFRAGSLVLAHNGHSRTWAQLGASIGLTDSECLARTWSRLRLPISMLAEINGVFMGFHEGHPFVVKGDEYDHLSIALHRASGAMLFASELDERVSAYFDQTIEAGSFNWYGGALDMHMIKPRSHVKSRYTTPVSPPTSLPGAQTSTPAHAPDATRSTRLHSLEDLRLWYQLMDQETARPAHSTRPAAQAADRAQAPGNEDAPLH